MRANFAETKIPHPGRSGNLILRPGELIGSLRGFEKDWGWSRPRVLRFLRYLRAEEMVTTFNEIIFTRIKILNWEKYQREEKDPGTGAGGGGNAAGNVNDGRTPNETTDVTTISAGGKAANVTTDDTSLVTTHVTTCVTHPKKDKKGNNNKKEKKESSVHSTSHVAAAPTRAPEGTPDGDASGLAVVVGRDGGTASEGQTAGAAHRLSMFSVRCGAPLLEQIGVEKAVARRLAGQYPVGRIYDITEAARKQSNPGGWARRALEGCWTVPAANGDGLAKLTADLEAEVAARKATWARAGGVSRPAPDRPPRLPDESDRDYMVRFYEWIKGKKSGKNADSKPGNGQETGAK